MDGKGREGTYNYVFPRRLGRGSRGGGLAQGTGGSSPCHPAGAAHEAKWDLALYAYPKKNNTIGCFNTFYYSVLRCRDFKGWGKNQRIILHDKT